MSPAQYTQGILAALAGPFAMTLGFIIWDNQWIGSAYALNLYKCCTASLGFAIVTIISRKADYYHDETRRKELFPSEIFTPTKVGYLMLSSTIGVLIGDLLWLEGLQRLGAKRVIVMDTLKPFVAVIMGYFILGEQFQNFDVCVGAMVMTVWGVAIVSFEKENSHHDNKDEGDNEKGLQEGEEDDVLLTKFKRGYGTQQEEEEEQENVIAATSDIPMTKTTAFHSDHDDNNTNHSRYKQKQSRKTAKSMKIGYMLASTHIILDTYGSLLTKENGVGMTTWEINLIRFGFAGMTMLCISCIMVVYDKWYVGKRNMIGERDMELSILTEEEQVGEDNNIIIHNDNSTTIQKTPWYRLPKMSQKCWIYISSGVFFVTFVYPSFSNYALFQIALALTLTLSSVGPLYALPLSWIISKEKMTWRGMMGALIAVAGIVILSFLGQLSS